MTRRHAQPPRHEESPAPVGVAVLELLERVEIPLCPRTIGVNLGCESATVHAACRRLAAAGLLARAGRGDRGYVLTPRGEDYLAGNETVSTSVTAVEDPAGHLTAGGAR